MQIYPRGSLEISFRYLRFVVTFVSFALLVSGCSAFANFHETIPCASSAWFNETKEVAWSLTPGAKDQQVQERSCDTGGGYFTVALHSDYSRENIQRAFDKAAVAHGWKISETDPAVFKCVEGIATSMYLIDHELPQTRYFISIESEGSDDSCKSAESSNA